MTPKDPETNPRREPTSGSDVPSARATSSHRAVRRSLEPRRVAVPKPIADPVLGATWRDAREEKIAPALRSMQKRNAFQIGRRVVVDLDSVRPATDFRSAPLEGRGSWSQTGRTTRSQRRATSASASSASCSIRAAPCRRAVSTARSSSSRPPSGSPPGRRSWTRPNSRSVSACRMGAPSRSFRPGTRPRSSSRASCSKSSRAGSRRTDPKRRDRAARGPCRSCRRCTVPSRAPP
jgi:hypothetical protein